MPPYSYGQQMSYNAWQPDSYLHATDTALSMFFQRYLWQDLIGVLKWTVPDTWDYDYFCYTLYMYGFVAVLNTTRFGVIPQQCTVRGYNVFYRPTHAIITNPIFDRTYDLQIGTQCSIIRVNADWCGMWDLITYYADLMATACSAIGVNLLNSKLAYVFLSDNTASRKTFQEMYDKIASGQPAVFVDKNAMSINGEPKWTLFDLNVQNHYISDKLLVDLQKIKNMFHEEIGIPNGNTEKKERMIVDEINANNIATTIGTMTRLNRLKKCCEETNKLFGNNLSKKISVDWLINPMQQGGANNDGGNTRPTDNIQTK